MKIIDVIGIGLVVLGIAMTLLNFRAARTPVPGMQSFTVHEPQGPRSEFSPRGRGNNL
ncbi:MAG: hypothetical protein ACT4O2_13705 [Beijerinckiaceae bacterium]